MLGRWQVSVIAVLTALLLALPYVLEWIDEPFYLSLAARIMIFAIAAVSLDLILGFGGMVRGLCVVEKLWLLIWVGIARLHCGHCECVSCRGGSGGCQSRGIHRGVVMECLWG